MNVTSRRRNLTRSRRNRNITDIPDRSIGRQWRVASFARTRYNPLSEQEALERQIDRLPALATSFYDDVETFHWGPILRELLVGTRDHSCVLYKLRGHEAQLLRHIFSYVASEWAQYVTLTLPASCVGRLTLWGMCRFKIGRSRPAWKQRERMDSFPIISQMSDSVGGPQGFVAFAMCGNITFPESADRNVNMMPFIFGDKSSLPSELQCYYDCIEECPYLQEEVGKVGYLTVHESYIDAGKAQRREGLHIETPGSFTTAANRALFSPGREHSWGRGIFFEPDMYDGGIYMASSVSNTSEVWDALVDKRVNGIVDHHGSCEHLRPLIGPGTKLEANQLVWMTDCTPHEALPQEKSGYRQFFRVVTSNISHWFADHSTPNPAVPLPGHIDVVYGNKFEG